MLMGMVMPRAVVFMLMDMRQIKFFQKRLLGKYLLTVSGYRYRVLLIQNKYFIRHLRYDMQILHRGNDGPALRVIFVN